MNLIVMRPLNNRLGRALGLLLLVLLAVPCIACDDAVGLLGCHGGHEGAQAAQCAQSGSGRAYSDAPHAEASACQCPSDAAKVRSDGPLVDYAIPEAVLPSDLLPVTERVVPLFALFEPVHSRPPLDLQPAVPDRAPPLV